MDWWIDRFWPCLDLPLARPGGSRPVRFSTIFPIPFYIDFRMHFGTDLASNLEPFFTFSLHFGINFSTVEFVWIFIEFRWICGTLKPWKIQFLLDTLVKNKEIAHSDFTSILYQHLGHFGVEFWFGALEFLQVVFFRVVLVGGEGTKSTTWNACGWCSVGHLGSIVQ